MIRKTSTKIIIFLAVALVVYGSIATYVEEVDYRNHYLNYWELSDRSSTLEAKEKYIDKFVTALENDRNRFAEYSSILMRTPDNRFDNNLAAVTTLRDRLRQISHMNESSFEYQVAIQQITAQEQGEAGTMMTRLRTAFELKSYPIVYFIGWIGTVLLIAFFISIRRG